jgi:SnoaL-like domain
MSYSISTLLKRNLQDVFGEGDPERRRAAIDELYTEDVVFYDPSKGVYRGRDEIDRIAGAIKATHPDFSYQPIAEPEEVGDGGRVPWVSGRPGEARNTPERISSSPGTAGLPPSTSSSTSCPEPGLRCKRVHRTTGARCQSLHSRQGMQASIRTSVRR